MPEPKESALARILLVDDDVAVIQVLRQCLAGVGQLRFATHGAAALRLATEEPPDLVLLDAEMPGLSGVEVWQAMQAEPLLRDVPVIFVTSHSDAATEERWLAMGAADFIAKPIRPIVLAARVRLQLRLKTALDRLKKLATTDALTQCANRRVLDESLTVEWQRALRGSRPLSILLLDVDHFKRFNDIYGHLQGDQALLAVAQALRQSAGRIGDLVARYGGEEFVALLPDTARSGAEAVAAHLHQRIEQLQIAHSGAHRGRLTVSVGIASFDANSLGWGEPNFSLPGAQQPAGNAEKLLALADGALYASKQAGRACSTHVQIDGRPRDAGPDSAPLADAAA